MKMRLSLLSFALFIAFLGMAAAQQCAQEPCAQRADALALRFLGGKLDLWQERLNLKDWKISVVMASPSELRPGSLGNIRWDAVKMNAVIRVLRVPESQVKSSAVLDDMEFTLVHELIHLEMASLPRSEASRRVEEHAVNRIAQALLKLDRERPQPSLTSRTLPAK
jgi:hypothetical protein